MRTLTRFAVLAAVLGGLVTSSVHAATAKPEPARSGKARPASGAKWQPVVPFLEDDFGRALALAKERQLPVFIEGWAPW
jgi:hypothetical protein